MEALQLDHLECVGGLGQKKESSSVRGYHWSGQNRRDKGLSGKEKAITAAKKRGLNNPGGFGMFWEVWGRGR